MMRGTKALPANGSERGASMDWFERYPVLLVPVIIVTTELWSLVKRFVASRRHATAHTDDGGPSS